VQPDPRRDEDREPPGRRHADEVMLVLELSASTQRPGRENARRRRRFIQVS